MFLWTNALLPVLLYYPLFTQEGGFRVSLLQKESAIKVHKARVNLDLTFTNEH